jgi:hypothetical protein
MESTRNLNQASRNLGGQPPKYEAGELLLDWPACISGKEATNTRIGEGGVGNLTLSESIRVRKTRKKMCRFKET